MSANGDHEMGDAAAGAEIDAPVKPEKQRLRLVRDPERASAIVETNIRQLPGSSDTAASFAFEREDHTLGNALRYMIMKK
jgi:DNA-directed RNA polymerase I and III subunit RPAC2